MDLGMLELLRCPVTGQRLRLQVFESQDGDVTSGQLCSDAASYPVVDSIPVMRPRQDHLTALLRSGLGDRATARALFDGVPRTRLDRFLPALRSSRLTRRPADAVAAFRDERRSVADARLLGLTPRTRAAEVVARQAYLDALEPSEDAFNYFTYRLGTPRHLVGLALAEHVLAFRGGPVLDVGCGAGQLTSFIARTASQPTVGIDSSYLLLWMARAVLPSHAQLVCGDARFLPFEDGSFEVLFSSDVLSYVTEKRSVLREGSRVLRDGGALVLASLRNAEHEHVYGGESLTPSGWEAVMTGWPHVALDDESVLADYLAGRGLAAGSADRTRAFGQTLSIVGESRSGQSAATQDSSDLLVDGAPLQTWPHARGGLRPHPLYRRRRLPDGSSQFFLQYPSPTYERDNPLMATYMLPSFSAEGTDPSGRGSDSRVQDLVAHIALLTHPGAEDDQACPVPVGPEILDRTSAVT